MSILMTSEISLIVSLFIRSFWDSPCRNSFSEVVCSGIPSPFPRMLAPLMPLEVSDSLKPTLVMAAAVFIVGSMTVDLVLLAIFGSSSFFLGLLQREKKRALLRGVKSLRLFVKFSFWLPEELAFILGRMVFFLGVTRGVRVGVWIFTERLIGFEL